jgi:hypothetical protein
MFIVYRSAASSTGAMEVPETGNVGVLSVGVVGETDIVDLALFFRFIKLDFIEPNTLLRLEFLRLSIVC